MPSRLRRVCDGILEAGWLVAVILAPLFFNIYSSRIFEPDKIAIVRSLALVILGAWVVKLVEDGKVIWDHFRPAPRNWLEWLRIPLVLPVAGLVLSYVVATIFSVTPSVSVWGSYQRLQGTYTTFSYVVIFAAIAANLRSREQVERLFTSIILASFPISLYGVMQRANLDPIPWGGDVTYRIATTLGNSIFAAAYLIMAFPITVVRIMDAGTQIIKEQGSAAANFVRLSVYVLIATLQIVAIYYTQSRGPTLGGMASLFILAMLISIYYKRRILAMSMIGLAIAGGVFIVLLNVQNGPLESLRNSPSVGRFSQMLNAQSNNALVRFYIWKGAAEMVLPHAPINFPDGNTDRFNALRPLIGFGPESMYVAYNPFYPPELSLVERRNASPDRSHNEGWDSLVITGLLGFIVYLGMMGAIIYFGFKWLGLIDGELQRLIFLVLYGAGAIGGAIGFVQWRGIEYLGIGLPFGIITSLVVYLIWAALTSQYNPPQSEHERARAFMLMGLLAVFIAHFAEINFGIAIVSTRVYFWVYAALMFVVGYIFPRLENYTLPVESRALNSDALSGGVEASVVGSNDKRSLRQTSKKKRSSYRPTSTASLFSIPEWFASAVIGGLVLALILGSLGFGFISNSKGGENAWQVLWLSLTRLKGSDTGGGYGVMLLFLLTWLIGALLYSVEISHAHNIKFWSLFGVVAGVSIFAAGLFWLSHAGYLQSFLKPSSDQGVIPQVMRYEAILSRFYWFGLLVLIGLGVTMGMRGVAQNYVKGPVGIIIAVVSSVLVLVSIAYTNLRVIQADIAFKIAEPFATSPSWPVAISIYQRANELAPNEDYYYLFLGRAYLEQARVLSAEQTTERDRLVKQAETDLLRAQSLNPLNTDHTANLARLYNFWANVTPISEERQQRAMKSADYFRIAVKLSPQNARLWDEGALVYMNLLNQPDQGLPWLETALKVDPYYDWTYALYGDYYVRKAQLDGTSEDDKDKFYRQATEYYQKAVDLVTSDTSLKSTYLIVLGNVWTQLAEVDAAIDAYEQALSNNPQAAEAWQVQESLARLYFQKGDRARTAMYIRGAIQAAPDDQKGRLQALLDQLNSTP